MGLRAYGVAMLAAAATLWIMSGTQKEKPLLAATEPDAVRTLEADAVAHPGDPAAVRALAQAYLDARQPGLAIVLSRVPRSPSATTSASGTSTRAPWSTKGATTRRCRRKERPRCVQAPGPGEMAAPGCDATLLAPPPCAAPTSSASWSPAAWKTPRPSPRRASSPTRTPRARRASACSDGSPFRVIVIASRPQSPARRIAGTSQFEQLPGRGRRRTHGSLGSVVDGDGRRARPRRAARGLSLWARRHGPARPREHARRSRTSTCSSPRASASRRRATPSCASWVRR